MAPNNLKKRTKRFHISQFWNLLQSYSNIQAEVAMSRTWQGPGWFSLSEGPASTSTFSHSFYADVGISLAFTWGHLLFYTLMRKEWDGHRDIQRSRLESGLDKVMEKGRNLCSVRFSPPAFQRLLLWSRGMQQAEGPFRHQESTQLHFTDREIWGLEMGNESLKFTQQLNSVNNRTTSPEDFLNVP